MRQMQDLVLAQEANLEVSQRHEKKIALVVEQRVAKIRRTAVAGGEPERAPQPGNEYPTLCKGGRVLGLQEDHGQIFLLDGRLNLVASGLQIIPAVGGIRGLPGEAE